VSDEPLTEGMKGPDTPAVYLSREPIGWSGKWWCRHFPQHAHRWWFGALYCCWRNGKA